MSYTNKTTHYELPQYVSGDIPAWLSDFNDAMQTIDSAIYDVASAEATSEQNVTALGTRVTSAENSVSAMQTALGQVQTAVAENTADIATAEGNINGLGTRMTTVETKVTNLENEDAEDIPYDNTDSGLTATNVQDAIDEIAQGGGTGVSGIRYDATTGYIQLEDAQGWFNWAKAGRALFDAIVDPSIIQTMGYSTYSAPTVTGALNNITIQADSSNGLGWAYIPAQGSAYTVHIEGNLTVASPYSGSGREAIHLTTYDSLSGGSSSGATNLKTYASTTSNINDTFTIPAGKIFGINVDGVNNGGVSLVCTVFNGN